MWWQLQRIAGAALLAMRHLPGGRHPWGLLIWFSLCVTLVALMVMRLTMNRERVVRQRNRALARLMEFRLYQHELGTVFAIFGRAVMAIARYLALWLMPLVVLTVVLWPVFAQAYLCFHYRPYRVGEPIQVKAVARDTADWKSVTLKWADPGSLEWDGEPFRSKSERETVWRLRARRPGRIGLHFVVNDTAPVEIPVVIGEQDVQPVVPTAAAADRIVWGAPLAQRPWPAGSRIERVNVTYPRQTWQIGSIQIHWLLACFMLCMMMGLVLKPVVGVEF